MTISTTTARVRLAADGTSTDFSFPYYFEDEGHLAVYLSDASGFEMLQIAASDYVVAGAGDPTGGTVSFMVPPAAGEYVTVLRQAPMTQPTQADDVGTFRQQAFETQFDRHALQAQSLQEQIDRAVKLKPSSAHSGPDFPDPEAGMAIAWNAAGDGLENATAVADIAAAASNAATATQAAAEAAVSAVSAAASADTAETAETNAQANADLAALSASNAAASESSAADSEMAAALSKTNSAASETNALTSETNALASETNALASANAAAISEANAATSEAAAAVSATDAAASADAAATFDPSSYYTKPEIDASIITTGERAKLAGIEDGAEADQTDAEIETAYNNRIALASQAEMEAGTENAVRRFTPERIRQAIEALGNGGGGIAWSPSDNTGGSDMTSEINALIAALPAELANVTLAAGTYLINSDIVFTGFDQGTRLDFSGCKFTGTGRVVFDSCKHITMIGADGRKTDLVLRSIWYSSFHRCMFSDIVLVDQIGSNFTSIAWVSFFGGLYQRIHKPHIGTSTGYTNEICFYSVAFRGDTTQGFSGTKSEALLLEGDANCQSWKFYGGDFSEHTNILFERGASNAADIELIFDGIYFDNFAPPVADGINTIIVVRNCHTAGTYAIEHNVGFASRGNYELRNVDHGLAWLAGSVRNLFPNGDLDPAISYDSGDSPPGPFGLGGVTLTNGSGAGYHDNYVSLTRTSGTLWVTVPHFPFDTAATFQMVARSKSGYGTQGMRMAFGNPLRYRSFTLSESEWSFVTMSPDGIFAAGSTESVRLFLEAGGGFGIDIAYIGVFTGVAAPFLP